MSVENRKKFFEGLAQARALGYTSFKRLYPATTRIKVTASADCAIDAGQTFKVPAGENFCITQPVKAGQRIVIKKQKAELPLSVSIVFEFADATTMTVSGGDSTEKQCQIVFLCPIPKPFVYSQPITKAFGLDVSTKGVSVYPDCR